MKPESRNSKYSPNSSNVDLEGVTQRIVDHFRPRRVVLFGSRARNDADSQSDLDLFIEMETDRRPPERAAEVAQLFGLRPWSLDVVVYTPEEVEQRRGVIGTLLARIEREGAPSMSVMRESNYHAWLEKARHDLLNIDNNLAAEAYLLGHRLFSCSAGR